MDKETTVPEVRRSGRLYYLDWIRIIALAGVILQHSIVIPGDWYDDAVDLTSVSTFGAPVGIAGITVFFLVSGSSSMFALDRRTSPEYLKERVLRLGVPFLVFSFILLPYCMWAAAQLGPNKISFLSPGTTVITEGSFWDVSAYIQFIGYTYSDIVPNLVFVADQPITPGWANALGAHLWFLAFLFVFSVAGLPALQWLRSGGAQSLVNFASRVANHRLGLVAFALPVIVVGLVGDAINVALGVQYLQQGWGSFFRFFAVFVLGGLLFCDQRIVDGVRRLWPWVLLGSVIGIAGLAWSSGFEADRLALNSWTTSTDVFVQGIFLSLIQWCFAVLLLRLGMAFLNRGGNGLLYCLGISVATYVLHYPVFVTVYGVLLSSLADMTEALLSVSAWLVWLIALVVSLTILWVIIEFIVRPIPPLRFLLGVPRRRLPSPPSSGVNKSITGK